MKKGTCHDFSKVLASWMQQRHTIFTADGSSTIERLRFTFTPNGKREFVTRD